MKKIALGSSLLALILTGPPVFAQSLESEIAKLLDTHPVLQSAKKKISEAEEGINRRFSDYFPTVNVTSDYGRQITDNPTLRANQLSPLKTYQGSSQITVTQNLFKGFRSISRHKQAKFVRELAGLALTSKEQNLLFDGAAAYLDVIRRKKLLDLTIKNEKIIKDQLALQDERVEIGSGVGVDVLFAKARFQIAKERRLVFEGEFLNSLSQYNRVFGGAAEVDKMKTPNIVFEKLPDSVDLAHSIALEKNPTVKDSLKTVELTREGKRLARTPFYPRIDLIGIGNIETDYDGVDGLRRDVSVMLRVSWDIFSGLSTPAESRAAILRFEASINDRDDVRRETREDVQLAWDRLATARKRSELLKNAVNIAAEVHRARLKLGEVGKETLINILDAQSEVFTAEIDATDAEYDSFIAVYRLLLAIGQLQPNVFAAEKQLSFYPVIDREIFPLPNE